jgi:glucose-6-phosphate isomerase
VTPLTQTPAWQALAQAHRAHAGITLTELFAAEAQRPERYSFALPGLTLDASKTHLTPTVRDRLLELAEQENVLGWRDRLFAGERINTTENVAALHAALRTPEIARVTIDGERVDEAVARARRRMDWLVEAVVSGELRAADGGPFTDVVHIGMGGSDRGPRLACAALAPFARSEPRVHFVTNIDASEREAVLARIEPARTLFIVASKTFTTVETLANARAAWTWLTERVAEERGAGAHFVAITAQHERARAWGIPDERILPLWDWVGGRYSLWSPLGLPVAFAVGPEQFDALLGGAAAMDRHFRDTPARANMPLWLALVGLWYRNFVGTTSHVVVPYSTRLADLPGHLQQLEMESNGKSVDRHGCPVDYATAPAVWGEVGTNAQHAFFQWLHQGTEPTTCDVIALADDEHPDRHALAANALGQTAALAAGRSTETLRRAGVAEAQRPHRAMTGDRASVTLLLDGLNPDTLGRLLALYEHKVFAQAMLWRINPFDQWGVERGKELARALFAPLAGEAEGLDDWDASTRALVRRYRGARQPD